MRGSLRAGLAGVLAAGALLTAGCENAPATVAVGGAAPAYAAATLEGDTVSLADLNDGAVMLNVWATWCHPCREEMPALQALHENFADEGLRVVGVTVDAAGAADDVRAFTRAHGIEFLILHDPQKRVERTFQTTGVPVTFLIDRDGRIAARWIGEFDPMSEDAQAKVRAALAP